MKYAHIIKEYHVEYLGIITEMKRDCIKIQPLFSIQGLSSLDEREFNRASFTNNVKIVHSVKNNGASKEDYPELFM